RRMVPFPLQRYRARRSKGVCRLSSKGEDAYAREREKRPKRPFTDSGNAELLVDLYGKRFRFVKNWNRFIVWSGTHWQEDVGAIEVGRLAKRAVREIKGSAIWKKRSEERARRFAMVDLSRMEPNIAVEHTALDENPWLLNVENGTVDLKSGALRPHRRRDL